MPLAAREVESVIDLRGVRSSERSFPAPIQWLLREIHRPAAFLFPLRVFIGIGWLRSFAEKLGDPLWMRGQAVGDFLSTQAANGVVPVPAYNWFIGSVLDPGAPVIGWLVMLLQVGVGVAILTGTATNLALFVGVVMNVNFMLAGEVNPSAFYIVIQTILFVTGAGGVFGFDHLLGERRPMPSIMIVARTDLRLSSESDRAVIGLLTLQAALISWIGFAHVADFSPTGITDPGLVLGTVMGVAAFSLLILRLRLIDLRRLQLPTQGSQPRTTRIAPSSSSSAAKPSLLARLGGTRPN